MRLAAASAGLKIRDELADLEENLSNLAKVGNGRRKLILDAQFPPALNNAIARAYGQMAKDLRREPEVAVRSSATAEDLPEASFAGQLETYRTAPLAGALSPLDAYLLAGWITGLPAGIYHYDPRGHELERVLPGDRRRQLSAAALAQGWIGKASAVIVLTAVFRRTTRKYGDRGYRYVHLEAGHAAQNVYLQATSLSLGMTTVGAFHDGNVKAVLELPQEAQPLCLLPIGFPG